ncbi:MULTISPECIES: TIGR02281 family clan AA aspartic protease [unclassified Spirosoma]|uniref:retropepsin-like aspartic protease family protein n=1 Tax=unclassified Spirosoma TaxID=2621999 RepID=UPI000965FF6F|nr:MULTISPECIES: retropepsin-like aspartic protease [unclassified Spirosoma]MBN8826428.1 retroviral-like aspartic protease family protein [Spirosoma sp.]OJW75817.1 MAG: hypothetical protein BGO59_04865 [Spirosoma sp. 48-14]
MRKVSLGGLLLALLCNPAFATIQAGDTLSTSRYLNAINHWLFGRTEAAHKALRLISSQDAVPVERDAARYLLLEEMYYWTGNYHQYLHLADSMGFQSSSYEMARLLSNQPELRIHLRRDTLQVPFRLKHKAHAVVEVLINGRVVRLAVDSGAQRTFISNRTAKAIGLKKLSDIKVLNYEGQSVPASIGLADSLNLNGLAIYNLPVFSAYLPIPGIDGLLGWDVLRRFTIIIDYPNRQLSIQKSIPDSTLEHNLLGGSQPMLLVRGPSNNQLNFILDTGSNEKLRISPTGVTKIGPYQIGRKLSIGGSVGRLVHIGLEKQVKKLSIRIDGRQRQFRRSTLYKSDQVIGQFLRDGLIGAGAFRKGRLTLDAPNHHFNYVE